MIKTLTPVINSLLRVHSYWEEQSLQDCPESYVSSYPPPASRVQEAAWDDLLTHVTALVGFGFLSVPWHCQSHGTEDQWLMQAGSNQGGLVKSCDLSHGKPPARPGRWVGGSREKAGIFGRQQLLETKDLPCPAFDKGWPAPSGSWSGSWSGHVSSPRPLLGKLRISKYSVGTKIIWAFLLHFCNILAWVFRILFRSLGGVRNQGITPEMETRHKFQKITSFFLMVLEKGPEFRCSGTVSRNNPY